MSMRATGIVTGLLALLAGCGGGGGGGGAVASGPTNAAPILSFSISDGTTFTICDDLSFTVTATDPEGDLVDIELMNVPSGCLFTPVRGATSPATGTVRWHVHLTAGGIENLVFRATDDRGASRTKRLSTRVTGKLQNQGLQVGDVTGDGILDAVVLSHNADIASVVDVGAVYVFAGRTLPSGTPTATLTIPNAASSDRLGDAQQGRGVQLADVTGDGILDVVAGSPWADSGATADSGVILVWRGGAGLSGTPAPRATLRIPNPTANDYLGYTDGGNGIEILDLTGDGIPDILAGASYWDSSTTADVGAVFLWAGGAALAGTPAPRATLRVNGATANDRLGQNWWGWPTNNTMMLADVTNDGRLDLLVAAPFADNGTTQDAGAVYVWAFGPGFTGTQYPTSTLRVGGATAQDYLGAIGNGRGVQVADVTGDGTPDIVVGAAYVDNGVTQDVGAVYVWGGGTALTSTPTPLATLQVSGAAQWDYLGNTGGTDGIRLVDVSGDGTPDIVVGAYQADSGVTVDVGAIFVWAGGSALTASSTPSPLATLRPPGGTQWENFPNSSGSEAMIFLDVTGDGTLDLIAPSAYSDNGATLDVGAVHVWAGGSSLTGTPSVRATLRPSGLVQSDVFGHASWDVWARDTQAIDLTGDGVAEIVVGGGFVDGSVTDQGGVWVWSGGSSLTGTPSPLATLRPPSPTANDSFGYTWGATELVVVDVTGDGALDLVVGSVYHDLAGVQDAGGAFVFGGGTALSGTPSPLATLRRATPATWDYLTGPGGNGNGLKVADVNRDGSLDIVLAANNADVGGVSETGIILTFAGGPGLAGTPLPRATLVVPGAVASDNLASVWNSDGVLLADLTDDGALDVLGGAVTADVGTQADAGAAYLWAGGSTHVGQILLRAVFTATTPLQFDNFGY